MRAATTPICADARTTTTPPPIGQIWPGQGGAYCGICRGEAGQPDQHLIAVVDPTANFMGEWGEYGKDVPGATHRFDGRTNTLAMARNGSEIAQRIVALEVEGHKDLFIASQAQIQLACANAPELFDKGYHWSSTQYSRNYAFVQGFEFGDSCWYSKGSERRVRAFRGFPTSTL